MEIQNIFHKAMHIYRIKIKEEAEKLSGGFFLTIDNLLDNSRSSLKNLLFGGIGGLGHQMWHLSVVCCPINFGYGGTVLRTSMLKLLE